jgi:hypothetical protein
MSSEDEIREYERKKKIKEKRDTNRRFLQIHQSFS